MACQRHTKRSHPVLPGKQQSYLFLFLSCSGWQYRSWYQSIQQQKNGVKLSQIRRTNTFTSAIKMLRANRLDFIAQSSVGFSHEALSIGVNPDDFECRFELSSDDVSYVFQKDTPGVLIDRFQQAFDELQKEGKVEEIFNKHQDGPVL